MHSVNWLLSFKMKDVFFHELFSKCAKPALNAARRTSEVIFGRNPFILFKTGDDMRRFSLWCTLIFSSTNSAETGNSLFYYGDDDDRFFLTGPWRPGQFAADSFSLCCVKLTPISVIIPSSKLITLTLRPPQQTARLMMAGSQLFKVL